MQPEVTTSYLPRNRTILTPPYSTIIGSSSKIWHDIKAPPWISACEHYVPPLGCRYKELCASRCTHTRSKPIIKAIIVSCRRLPLFLIYTDAPSLACSHPTTLQISKCRSSDHPALLIQLLLKMMFLSLVKVPSSPLVARLFPLSIPPPPLWTGRTAILQTTFHLPPAEEAFSLAGITPPRPVTFPTAEVTTPLLQEPSLAPAQGSLEVPG
jgi:hypothetical protein